MTEVGLCSLVPLPELPRARLKRTPVPSYRIPPRGAGAYPPITQSEGNHSSYSLFHQGLRVWYQVF